MKVDRFQTYDEYKQNLTAFRLRFDSRVWTNCYLLRQDLERFIGNGSLYYIDNKDAYFVFVKETTHYLLFYFFPQFQPISLPRFPLPVFVPVVSNRNSQPAFEQIARESGFYLYRVFARMRAIYSELDFGRVANHPIRLARESEADRILELWQANSEIYFSGIPSIHTLQDWIRDEKVLVAQLDGTIRAAKMIEVVGQSLQTKLVAVDKNYRGLGISKAMFSYAASLCAPLELETYELQVNVDYAPAVKGYLKYGFAFTGRKIFYYTTAVDL